MQKLIDAYLKDQSPANFAKLQAYLLAHPMAIAVKPSAAVVLKKHGFVF